MAVVVAVVAVVVEIVYAEEGNLQGTRALEEMRWIVVDIKCCDVLITVQCN